MYLLDLLSLSDEIKEAFRKGQHTYREKPGSFNGLWTDLGIEKTVIKDSKSDGGVIGLTRKAGALLRREHSSSFDRRICFRDAGKVR